MFGQLKKVHIVTNKKTPTNIKHNLSLLLSRISLSASLNILVTEAAWDYEFSLCSSWPFFFSSPLCLALSTLSALCFHGSHKLLIAQQSVMEMEPSVCSTWQPLTSSHRDHPAAFCAHSTPSHHYPVQCPLGIPAGP